MPTYTYTCNSCQKGWTEFLGFNESPEKCPYCEQNNFKKSYSYTPTIDRLKESVGDRPKPGRKTREFIEQARQELKEHKSEIKR